MHARPRGRPQHRGLRQRRQDGPAPSRQGRDLAREPLGQPRQGRQHAASPHQRRLGSDPGAVDRPSERLPRARGRYRVRGRWLCAGLSALLAAERAPAHRSRPPSRFGRAPSWERTLVDGTGAPPVPRATVVVARRKDRVCRQGLQGAVPERSVTDVSGALDHARSHRRARPLRSDGLGRREARRVRRAGPLPVREGRVGSGGASRSGFSARSFARASRPSSTTAAIPGRSSMAAPGAETTRPRRAWPPRGRCFRRSTSGSTCPPERQFIHLKDPDAGRAGVRYLAARGADAVKIWFVVTPEQTVAASTPAVVAAGRRPGARLPLIVHATGLAEAKVAVKAGAHLLVHSVDDLAGGRRVPRDARSSGTVYCPTLTVFGGYARLAPVPRHGQAAGGRRSQRLRRRRNAPQGHERAMTARSLPIPPGAPRWRSASRSATAMMAANLKRISDAGIPIAMGTDAGNPLTLHGPSVYARDGGDAGGRADADGGPRRVDARRQPRHGRRKVTGTAREGQVRRPDRRERATRPKTSPTSASSASSCAAGVLQSLDELRAPPPRPR